VNILAQEAYEAVGIRLHVELAAPRSEALTDFLSRKVWDYYIDNPAVEMLGRMFLMGITKK